MEIECIQVAYNSPEGLAAMRLRHQVFVKEQNVPETLERDEYDAEAIHWVALEAGEVVGTLRMVSKGKQVKIGRVAVRKDLRGKGIGKLLMKKAMEMAQDGEWDEIILNAQLEVVEFYRRLEFRIVSDTFFEAGIPHQSMIFRLKT